MGAMTTRRRITRVSAESSAEIVDDVVLESPLTIALGGLALATTMRTPGHDLELVAGWLMAEAGVVTATDIVTMGAFTASGDDDVDTVRVALAGHVIPPEPRALLTSSSCGVCSSRLVTGVRVPHPALHSPGWSVTREALLGAPELMLAGQRTFARTGGLHAAAVLDPGGRVAVVREDVGRHNAVDKVMGHCLLDERVPLTDHLLVVSGRVSFEIVQKALAAGVAGIVAVSAPSSLAVDLAREHRLLLVAFCRNGGMNLYSEVEAVRVPS